jgi:hypothetical protein
MRFTRRALLASAAGLACQGSARAAGRLLSDDSVFELRQYTLRGGRRDTLISLFENHFIESQDAVGADVIGVFRDLDDPDRLVWIRGFRDMSVRRKALGSFYNGPVWHSYGPAANATMIDSDNVLLLRPASTGQGFGEFTTKSTGAGAMFGADIYYLDTAPVAQFSQFFDSILLPQFTAAGAQLVARLVTEEAKNDSPLPVREHDRTYVCLTRWSNLEAHGAFVRRYATLHGWRDSATEAILPALMRKPERLRLEPTARSPLR